MNGQDNRKWVEFLRKQHPPGTRIRLESMNDPYAPVEPGTLGTLQAIDDVGTYHVKWDNGRSLGLIVGEDNFSVLPPELQTLKLYMPMTVDCYRRNPWGDWENEPELLSDAEAAAYYREIQEALQNERMPEEGKRGLMTYYREADSVNKKVLSLFFDCAVRNGRLYGVAECETLGTLTPEEYSLLSDYITGQASDGFGEGFEQREISTDDGGQLHAHLWNGENWFLKTEKEMEQEANGPCLTM